MNRAHLERQEAAEDRYALECEPWEKYVARVGYIAGDGERQDERVRQVGETWDEYMVRTAARNTYLRQKMSAMDTERQADDAARMRRAQISDDVVNRLQAYQAALDERRTPSRHHLCVDYDKLQLTRFQRERDALTDQHKLLRDYTRVSEKEARRHVSSLADMAHSVVVLAEHEREAREEEERSRKEEEAARAAEVARLAEEERQREEAMRVRRQREEAEQAKRLERKRRDDEKRARLRADFTPAKAKSATLDE